MRLQICTLAALAFLFAACDTPERSGSDAAFTTWARFEGEPGATSFSALDQIDRSNVDRLEIAWTYENPGVSGINPIIVDSLMYVVGEGNTVLALHAGTGRRIWSSEIAGPGGIRARGLSYWESEDRADRRLFFHKGNYHMVAIDALTGAPIPTFGGDGRVDLREGLGVEPALVGRISGSTPGSVFEDLIVVTSFPGEGYTSAPGHVRAFDVRTGEQEWIFHTLPQPGEFGYDTWPQGRTDSDNVSGETARGAANVWGGMSVDVDRGIFYIPLGSASYDFYGIDRHGENLFANSLMALDARTGERIWHFQTVHHDLWDYDLTSTPVLLTVDHDGEMTDIVALATKTGMLFVFDRETGEPLWPIEERPVPPSDMPGEAAWPTQPFPTKPEPFVPLEFSLEEDLNPYLAEEERDSIVAAVRAMPNEGIYTPPSTKQTFQIPGNLGGANWGSSAGDPRDGTYFVLARNLPSVLELLPITAGNTGTGGSPIDDGQAIYQEQCQMCHGADLQGQPAGGVPSLQDITHRMSGSEFAEIMRAGSGTMPSFEQLDEDDLDVLQMYLSNPQLALAPGEGSPAGPGIQRYQSGWNHITDRKGLPIIKPPWVRLTAYDLNEGTIKWQVPVGEVPHLVEKGIRNTGASSLSGGPAVTAGGLVFQVSGDRLYAFDSETGAELWAGELPASSGGMPAVYQVDGRQFVAVSAPGGRRSPSQKPSYVAFALPEGPAAP
jgi:quinoprotein glucose dehydrogenase